MTSLQIATSRKPLQGMSFHGQPLHTVQALSPAINPPKPALPGSRSSGELPAMPVGKSLESTLFDNSASLKVTVSQVLMHLSVEWRDKIFSQLDRLLDIEAWEEDSSLIGPSSFSTFLRYVIYSGPVRVPSLGVSAKGHVLAAWGSGTNRIAVEFLAADKAVATVFDQGSRDREVLVWQGHIVDMKRFIERIGVSEWLK